VAETDIDRLIDELNAQHASGVAKPADPPEAADVATLIPPARESDDRHGAP
jgi:hypothetical protein